MITYLFSRWPRVALFAAVLMCLFIGEGVALAVSTTDVIEMFKYTYGAARLAYMASLEIVLWRILSKRKAPLGGRGQWIIPIRTRNTGVFQGNTEGGALTTRRSQPDTAEAMFQLQEFHGVWDISWKMLQDARKDEYSFARAVDFMDEAFKARVFRLINADFLGTGKGELGILPAADNQAEVTVRALPLVDLGLVVDLMDTDNNTINGPDGTAVTAIDVKNRTITTGTAGSSTGAGDYFTTADSVSSAGSLHMLGILAWLSDADPDTVVGDIGGIDRGTAGNEFFESVVMSNSGTNRPLTEDLLLQAMDLVRERGGEVISDWMSNLNIIRRYHESLRADTFFALGAVKEFGGKVGIGRDAEAMGYNEESEGETVYQFSGIPWRAETFFDSNKLIGFNRQHFWLGHGENEVPRPLSEIFDESVPYFSMPVTPAAKWEVLSYWQAELVGDKPTAGLQIADIAES
jgi:hypothetical protein